MHTKRAEQVSLHAIFSSAPICIVPWCEIVPNENRQTPPLRVESAHLSTIVVRLLSGSFQSLLELVQTAACIDELLLTGEEGVALGANFNSHFAALGGTGSNSFAASALNDTLYVIGMDSAFHFSIPRINFLDVL